MSPTTAQERSVDALGPRGGASKVKITPREKNITVTWTCGGSRTFTVEQLRKVIELVDGPATKHPLWLNPVDDRKDRFFTRLTDGRLTANEGMADNGTVDWVELKRALQATIAEILT